MEDKPDGRMCVRCGVVKPKSEFYGTGSGGLDKSCKTCRLEKQKEAKKARKARPANPPPAKKTLGKSPPTPEQKQNPAVEQVLSFFTPELRNALIEDCRRQCVKEIITLLQSSFL